MARRWHHTLFIYDRQRESLWLCVQGRAGLARVLGYKLLVLPAAVTGATEDSHRRITGVLQAMHVNQALGAFSRIQQVVSDAARLVGALGERSQQIGVVVEVIEDIADQTNLLALNAAIEAARSTRRKSDQDAMD